MRLRKPFIALAAVACIASGVFWIYRSISRSAERAAALHLADERKFAEAIPRLRAVLDRDPNDVEALEKLVDAMANSDGYLVADVLPLLNRWCELRGDDYRPFLKRMNAFVAESRRQEALQDGIVVLRLRPDHQEVRSVVARLLRDLGRLDEAERECETLLVSETPWRIEVKTLLATVCNEKGDHAKAARTVEEILAERPDYEPAFMLRGDVRYNLGRYEDAVQDLRKSARSKHPQLRQRSLHKLALSLSKLGREQEAREAFGRLAVLQDALRAKEDADQQSDKWESQLRAGRGLLAADYPDEAIQVLERALRRLGPDRDAFAVLADCYEKTGRGQLAELYRRFASERK